jgi:hypothetical protein
LDAHNWIPIRWKCGPLDVEQEKRREGFSARDAEVLAAWARPESLERLAGTPVDCLVLHWGAGSPADEEQRRAVAPLAAAARGRGLAVIGWVSGGDLRRAAQAAQGAGLSGVATVSSDPLPGGDVLRFGKRGFAERPAAHFVGDLEGVWPGMKLSAKEASGREAADAQTGPTSAPWLDSNAWYVRLARTLLSPQAMWLAFEPPDITRPVPATAYVQAIADTEVYGARWLVSLDPYLRRGLSEGQPSAADTWRTIGQALAFFRRHEAWGGYMPAGQLAVVSDYVGENEFLAFETLNLLARQSSLFQIVEKRRALDTPLGEVDAVLWTDADKPGAELLKKLYAFAEAGGTLITPPGWEPRGVPIQDNWTPRFQVSRSGRGRVAVAREAFENPQDLAEDAQLLMSHRRDRVRVYNQGAGIWHYATSQDGRAGVLHALLFPTPYPLMPMTVWFRKPWASGRLCTIAANEAAPAKRAVVEQGVEFHLPPASVYCATEVTA